MNNGVLYAILLFFSAYGIFSLAFFLKDFFAEKKYLKSKCLYTLIFLEEEELYPEEMVRALVYRDYKNDMGICDRKILVITKDLTGYTARRIQKHFKAEANVLVVENNALQKQLEGE